MDESCCSVGECGLPVLARTLCRKHYDHHRRRGTLDPFVVRPRNPGPFNHKAWQRANRKRLNAYNREWMRRYRAAQSIEGGS